MIHRRISSLPASNSDGAEALAEQVCAAREAMLPIVMAHENDALCGGCIFGHFFEVTPRDLIADGLYKALALAYYPGHFRPVSIALVAKKLGAASSRQGLRAWRSSRSLGSSKRNLEVVAVPSGEASSSTDAPASTAAQV